MNKLQPGDIIALDIKGKDVFGFVRGASESGANIVFLDYALSNHRAVMLCVNDTEGEYFDNEELKTCKATVLLTAQEYMENLWRLEHPDERPCAEIVENGIAREEGRQVPTYRIIRVENA